MKIIIDINLTRKSCRWHEAIGTSEKPRPFQQIGSMRAWRRWRIATVKLS